MRSALLIVVLLSLVSTSCLTGIDFAPPSCANTMCAEGTTCVENHRSNGELYVACALGDGDEQPGCQRDEDIAFCEGNTWVKCVGRYRVKAEDCGDRHCAEALGTALCVRTREADPSYDADAGLSTYCAGDVLTTCFGPFASGTEECAASERFCRAGTCVEDPNPDVRCSGRPITSSNQSYCDADVAVQCVEGFRKATHDCGHVQKRCVDLGSRVECRDRD